METTHFFFYNKDVNFFFPNSLVLLKFSASRTNLTFTDFFF